MYEDDDSPWATLLGWSRHRLYTLHTFLEAPPLSASRYIRNAVIAILVIASSSYILPELAPKAFDAKTVIALLALLVSGLSFVVNYKAAVIPAIPMKVRHLTHFGTPFGFTHDDPTGQILDQRNSPDANRIEISNPSKTDITIISAFIEYKEAAMEIASFFRRETRTKMPITIESGTTGYIRYEYARLAWALGQREREPTRPWLVLRTSDGRNHRFPMPHKVLDDAINLRAHRKRDVCYSITDPVSSFDLDGTRFQDHLDSCSEYLGSKPSYYPVRRPVDYGSGFCFSIKSDNTWGPSHLYPTMADCLHAIMETRDLTPEPQAYVLSQKIEGQSLVVAIGTEDRFTFATMGREMSPWRPLSGGELYDVIDALPYIAHLAGIGFLEPIPHQSD